MSRKEFRCLRIAVSLAALSIFCACAPDGSQSADNGGIGGTGISQGEITAFGSIFVNGVRWDIDSASISLDGAAGSESELRLGMNVRVIGDLATDGLSGSALSVDFDDALEGPIESAPVLVLPGGVEKTFTILGQTVVVNEEATIFADGATFAGLAMDQVLEVSGFVSANSSILATRVALRGEFPTVSAVSVQADVQNLLKNPDGSGVFDLGTITIRYLATTELSDITRADLENGLRVDVAGDLRASGSEIDANRIELEEDGLGQQDAEDVELEGLVSDFVSLSDFKLAGVPIDATGASLSPPTLVVANGVELEAEGRLTAGVLFAEELKAEDEEGEEVAIRASVTAVDPVAREVTMLGIVVFADGDTEIEDERDGDENFQFAEIQVGDWLEIEGFEAGPARARAKKIARKSVGPDVVLRAPVTLLDRNVPELALLDQLLPLGLGTAYFDELGQPRTEEEFFRTPGDVNLGDDVVVVDENAAQPDALIEVDTVSLD